MASDNTVAPDHNNIRESPSMGGDGGSALAPDFEGSVAESSNASGISTRIMDNSIDFDWPGNAQGNLTPKGNGSA